MSVVVGTWQTSQRQARRAVRYFIAKGVQSGDNL
jgi:hypothetical protein